MDDVLTAPYERLIQYEEAIQDEKKISHRKGSTIYEKQRDISERKKSFSKQRTASSMSTIFALTNSMVGSVCLVIPISFSKSGLIMSIIIMFVIGYISMKTSQLYLKHLREGETDLSQLIWRTLGKKYAVLFNFCSSLLMFLVGNIYFLLINQTAYPMLCFIFDKFGLDSSSYVSQDDMNNDVVFKKFSTQWLGCIIIVCVFPLFLIKNMKLIMKLAHGGFFAIGMYVCFVIYTFFDNLISGNLANNYTEVTYFSSDIAGIGGSFALAFMVHNAIAQIVSQSAQPEKNARDVSIGYMLAAGIYAMIGIFGSFGIVGRTHPDNAYTITQYFDSTSVPPFIINLFFAGHLVTAFPLFCFISKTQFFNLIYPSDSAPKWAISIYNIVFTLSCFSINMLNVNPGIVIGITGAVVGFLIVYFLPVLIHLKYFYQTTSPNSKEQLLQTVSDNIENIENSSNLQSDIESFKNKDLSNTHIVLKYTFYISIVAIGIYLALIQLLSIFKS